MLHRSMVLVVGALTTLVTSCGGCQDPPGFGTVVVSFVFDDTSGTPLDGLTDLSFSVVRVEAIVRETPNGEDGETRHVVVDEPTLIAFPNVFPGVPRVAAVLEVPAGFLAQLRFIVDDVSLGFDGTTESARIPSGPQTGLKVVPEDGSPFLVEADEAIAIRVRFSAEDQVVSNPGQGIIIRPTIRGEEVPMREASSVFLDRVAVQFVPTLSLAEMREFLLALDLDPIRFMPRLGRFTVRTPRGTSVTDALESLNSEPEVAFAIPVHFADVGSHDPITTVEPSQPWLDLIDLSDAWDVSIGSREIVVAVIDTGTSFMNSSLRNLFFINQGELPPGLTQIDPATGCPVGDVFPSPVGDCQIDFVDLNVLASSNPALLAANGIVDLGVIDRSSEFPNTTLEEAGFGIAGGLNPIDPYDLLLSTNPILINGIDDDGNCPGDTNGDCPGDTNGDGVFCGPGDTGFCGPGDVGVDDLIGWDFVGRTGIGDFNPEPDPESLMGDADNFWHGTAVISMLVRDVIGGLLDNGVMRNVRILPLRACCSTEAMRDALDYVEANATAFGIDIVVMTLTFPLAVGPPASDTFNKLLQCEDDQNAEPAFKPADMDLLREARELWAAGLTLSDTLFVQAVKDCRVELGALDDDILDWPAELALPTQINVTGTSSAADPTFGGEAPDDPLVAFGSGIVHYAAPGVIGDPVATTGLLGAPPFDAFLDRRSAVGTSFPTPMVAGVAGLVLSSGLVTRGDPIALRAWLVDAAHHGTDGSLTGFVESSRFLNACLAVEGVCP